MRNQFWYTVSEEKDVKKYGSFNLEYVIRSVQYDGNKSVVLLDDFHELKREMNRPIGKNGKMETRMVSEVVCSEVWLNEEDSLRFRQITEIPAPLSTTGYIDSHSLPTVSQKAVPTLA